MRNLVALTFCIASTCALGQDWDREARWAKQIVPAVMVGEVVWLQQKTEDHKFLALYTEAEKPRGALIIAHGRGWSPDYELYGVIRVKLAEAGYTTLSIQLPVLGGGAKVGDYLPTYPDAADRFEVATDYLLSKGFKNVAIVSHSLGAAMANQYLINARKATHIKAWAFIGIINGLEEMFRIKIPVLDVYGGKDWEITMVGSAERLKQIIKNPGSRQLVVADAPHFFEGHEDELVKEVVSWLDGLFHAGQPGETEK
jgi:pimeloyl-ACP methyl ester carboxylesterase